MQIKKKKFLDHPTVYFEIIIQTLQLCNGREVITASMIKERARMLCDCEQSRDITFSFMIKNKMIVKGPAIVSDGKLNASTWKTNSKIPESAYTRPVEYDD